MNTTYFSGVKQKIDSELFSNVIPFWEKYSPDLKHGGYYNCLDRDGSIYDTTKYVWLQGREAWLWSKLFNRVTPKPEWLKLSKIGIDFLRAHTIDRTKNRVYFSVTESGKPVSLQRKIFSECFYVMALTEYARAAERAAHLNTTDEVSAKRLRNEAIELQNEALSLFRIIWEYAKDWTRVGRPSFAGETPAQMLAVPMILLNLIEELMGPTPQGVSLKNWPTYEETFKPYVEQCIEQLLKHVKEHVYEWVSPSGDIIDSPQGRLLNPGHAIEAGWFFQHWAHKLERADWSKIAVEMVRVSHDFGWDKEFGGIYYFLDTKGYSPLPLEWNMKLWWPHCEALYAHLLNYSITGANEDLERFKAVYEYTFKHFPDPQGGGEWFGYLDRQGKPTHRFKGGPYKCAFHVPRALLLCSELLSQIVSKSEMEKK